ncbi:PAB-dependent poly(A)-specific ribonuclease subunit PAN3 [Venustampulla echinocandica]|uniref:PAN2-PAN3 deadenylation complex subunit PAN3 n=1 Tax=Venustampulla echinocandica TaxID=2656787 RepID=A0A370TZV8_9HELO|nr:PAB-dependent poly(A)-specific ribonuclease subunit PAN3 [Venustampulla echinocandica]RDL41069.1 PAB-dependent poly(A)-specific ribonuclease subunit PAN3 [Venustampulla echinocandica]
MARHQEPKTPNTNSTIRKKTLNVDSPSFMPATLPVPNKTSAISSQAANAAPFTPRGLSSGTVTPNPQSEHPPAGFNPAQIREFTPQNYDVSEPVLPTDGSGSESHVAYDPFQMPGVAQTLPTTPQYNPYIDESANMASNGAAYFQTSSAFAAPTQPLQYHLYAPIGPHREDLLAYQKHAHDFFMPEALREDLQKKAEATLQVMPNSQLPNLDTYHTLVALDTSHRKSATVFGYPSWVYKATSMKNGYMYCLRRLEGYRLTNERAIRSVKDWRRVNCGGVVSVVDAFTTRAFGDSSLIFVTNYHPLSKTLVEHHFTNTSRFGNRASQTVPEPVLWNYIVQIASAVKAVHSANLAVRCMDPSKVMVTDKGRIRLGACSVLDVVQFEAQRPLAELQQEDFIHFGKLILSIATNNLSVTTTPNLAPLVEQLARNYSSEFRDTVVWLLTPAQAPATKGVGELLSGIATHVVDAFDSSLHANDTLYSELAREVENGRLARLLMKLGTINERPEYEGDVNWSETSERYILKLFRDYVFHQVNAEGRPVLDMGHMVACLNKLDAGSQEKISLASRDEQSVFVVTYSEIKKQVNAAWSELQKPTRR